MSNNRLQGFTMTELMIVILIVGILAGVAYPGYQNSVSKSRRADTQGALVGFAGAMERYFSQNNTYVGAANGGAPNPPIATVYPSQAPLSSTTKYYNLTVQSEAAGSFTLRATPIGPQAGNGYLELLHTGVQRWDENDDGDTADAGENDWEG